MPELIMPWIEARVAALSSTGAVCSPACRLAPGAGSSCGEREPRLGACRLPLRASERLSISCTEACLLFLDSPSVPDVAQSVPKAASESVTGMTSVVSLLTIYEICKRDTSLFMSRSHTQDRSSLHKGTAVTISLGQTPRHPSTD